MSTTTDVMPLLEKQVSKRSKYLAYYLCDELDCGFHYHYKIDHGPSPHHPMILPKVFVVALNKHVKIKLVGWGKDGFDKLIDHGHEGYIFPVNLHDKPYRIEPKLKGSQHEDWLRLIANVKGEPYIPTRKTYVLVSEDGKIFQKKMFNEEEFVEAMDFHKKWMIRHPDKEPLSWKEEC